MVRVTDDLACGETQEEHLWDLILRRSDVEDHGASTSGSSGHADVV